nr:hypothetical protein [uncultured archaeon]AQS33876.1 hypothetical protein [uncultured archaeon]
MKKNPVFVLAVVGLDLLFVIFCTFIYSLVGNQIAAHAVLIANQVSPMLAQGQTGLLAKLFQGSLQPLTVKLLVLVGLFFVLLYVGYVVLQGLAWWFSSQVAQSAHSLRKYVVLFAKLNVLWLVLFAFIKLLDVFLGLRYQLIRKFAPSALNVSAPIITVLFVALGIVVFLSYGRLRAREFLKIPFLQGSGLLAMCVILFLVVWAIVDLFSTARFELRLLVQILFLPIFVLIRVYMIRVVNHVRA